MTEDIGEAHDSTEKCDWDWSLLSMQSANDIGTYKVVSRRNPKLMFKVITMPIPNGMRIGVKAMYKLDGVQDQGQADLTRDKRHLKSMSFGQAAHLAIEQTITDLIKVQEKRQADKRKAATKIALEEEIKRRLAR